MDYKRINYKRTLVILILVQAILLLSGCGQKTTVALDCPFTDFNWSTSPDEMTSTLGAAAKTYDSIYGGTTYVYSTTYEGRDGSVKYMFDDKEALMCVAFTYVPDTSDEVLSLYNEVHSSLLKSLGESGYETDADTNYGDVWYRDEGDVIISCMITSDINSLQYSYLNPIVSKYQMEEAAK